MTHQPVTLRPRGWQVVVEFALPLMCVGFIGWSLVSPGEAGALENIAFVLVGGGSLIWLWLLMLRRADLAPDRLDYFNGFWTRGMDRRDVKGTRGTEDKESSTFLLVPKDPESRAVKFPTWIIKHPDAAYWFEGVVDLDAIDSAAADAALAADPTFGAAPEQRRTRVKIINYAIAGLTIAATFVSFGFCYGWSTPEAILVIVAMPFLAVLLNLAIPRMFRLANENGNSDPRPSLGGLLYIPSLFLPMAAFMNLKLASGFALLWWALPTALVAVFYLHWRAPDPRRSFGAAAYRLGFAVAFFWSAFAYGNVLLDIGPHAVFPVAVQALRIDHDSDSTTHYATLAPWGGRTEASEEQIPYWIYDGLHVGDKLCVTEGRGLFGVGWYDVGKCPAPGARTS